MNALALLALTVLAGAPDEQVLVRSDHAEVVIGKEHYRLVTQQAPLRAVVMRSSGTKRLVINVIRIGDEGENSRGGTPLKVTVGKRSHVFPNRPSLVDKRRVTRLGEGLIASFPVRYPMRLARGRQVPIRISLRRPEKGGKVGVLLTLEDPQDTLLTPLTPQGDTVASAKPRAGRDKRKRRRRRSRRAAPAERRDTEQRSSKTESAEGPENTSASAEAQPQTQPEAQPEEATKVASARRAPSSDAGPAEEAPSTGGGQGDDGGTTDVEAADADAGPMMTTTPAPPPLPPAPTSGRLKVVVRDQMGGSFMLDVAELSIDGRPVVGGPTAGSQRELFNGVLPPGQHEVQVHLAYCVDAGWFFSYLEGYTFHLSEGAFIDLKAGDDVRVEVVGEQVGGWFAELEDKPSIRVKVERR